MQAATYPEVPDDFGHWLAGFIDGEGSFYIQRYSHAQGHGYQMRFALKLRDDDWAVIERCVGTTGVGYAHYYDGASQRRTRPGSKPQVEWLVVTKPDCARLVTLLDRFPLRSKKARDYAIWREAVVFHAGLRVRSAATGGRAPHRWGPIPELARRLPAVRAYESRPGRVAPIEPELAQLWSDRD